MKAYDYIIGIDPGVQTGYCAFSTRELRIVGRKPRPEIVGYTNPPTSLSWEQRVVLTGKIIQEKLISKLPTIGLCQAWIEQPHNMENEGGYAAQKSESFSKLCLAAGLVWGQMARLVNWDVHLVEVRTWKGQMPKAAVTKRLANIVHPDSVPGISSHAWDATGIALWAAEKF